MLMLAIVFSGIVIIRLDKVGLSLTLRMVIIARAFANSSSLSTTIISKLYTGSFPALFASKFKIGLRTLTIPSLLPILKIPSGVLPSVMKYCEVST